MCTPIVHTERAILSPRDSDWGECQYALGGDISGTVTATSMNEVRTLSLVLADRVSAFSSQYIHSSVGPVTHHADAFSERAVCAPTGHRSRLNVRRLTSRIRTRTLTSPLSGDPAPQPSAQYLNQHRSPAPNMCTRNSCKCEKSKMAALAGCGAEPREENFGDFTLNFGDF